MAMSSTVKISVAFGGMTGGEPRSPSESTRRRNHTEPWELRMQDVDGIMAVSEVRGETRAHMQSPEE